ncbi:MAG TPA: CBS domain-containing protein [Minicystis sp.]|nr:CBS domain-containing protein [Minicystis sp.]
MQPRAVMKPHRRLRVKDIMSQPVTAVRDTDTIGFAELAMKLVESRHVPVVDADGRLVGVLSARDALRAEAQRDGLEAVAKLMHEKPHTVRPQTSAEHAIDLLIEHRIGCLPVVDDDGRPIGIVTDTDVLVVARQALEGEPFARARA